jgi:hypothetical protein
MEAQVQLEEEAEAAEADLFSKIILLLQDKLIRLQ